MTFLPSLAQLGRHAPAGGGSYDTDTVAWVAAVVAAGGTVSGTRESVVDTLITSLKSAGIWSKLDRLWLFAAANSTQSLIDLKARASATATNSPTFTADHGYSSSAGKYINSNFAPSTAGGNYATNAGTLFAWLLTSGSGFDGLIGTDDYKEQLAVNSTNLTGDIAQATDFTHGAGVGVGLFGYTRSASNAVSAYANGSVIGTGSNASSSLGSGNLKMVGAQGQPVEGSQSICGFGGALTGTDHSNLYTALYAYLHTGLGVV